MPETGLSQSGTTSVSFREWDVPASEKLGPADLEQ